MRKYLYNRISDNSDDGLYLGSLSPIVTNNLITRNRRGLVCDYAPTPSHPTERYFPQIVNYDFYMVRTENDIIAPKQLVGNYG